MHSSVDPVAINVYFEFEEFTHSSWEAQKGRRTKSAAGDRKGPGYEATPVD